jgi:glycine/D-amino acid oxidase-like deaminating enzyme
VTQPVTSADVVIVGCGVIGLATAARLVASNLSVVLVDELGVANGASGASGGLVRAFDCSASARSWAADGLHVYLQQGWQGRWPEVRKQGSLTLMRAEDLECATVGLKSTRDAGHSAELLSSREMCSRFPGLALPSDLIGVYEIHAGWLPARDVVKSMLRDAGAGATVLATRATEVLTANSRVSGVRTTAGCISAGVVLLAAGVGSSNLAQTVGVRLPLRNRAVGYCLFRPRTVDHGLPTLVDSTTGAWLRRWNHNTVLAGVPSSECGVPSSVTEGVSPAEQKRVRRVVEHRYPGLVGSDVVGGIMAYDAFVPNGEGTVTAWPEPQGLVTATGWNGGGFKLAPAIGMCAASLIREVIA